MALLVETGSGFSIVAQVVSRLAKLRHVLELQTLQLSQDVESEEDQCRFLEKTLHRLSESNGVWKNLRASSTSREIRRRSHAHPVSGDTSMRAGGYFSVPSGGPSTNSRRPSAEIKLEEQNIYSSVNVPRNYGIGTLHPGNSKPEVTKLEDSQLANHFGMFSRRSTVIEGNQVSKSGKAESLIKSFHPNQSVSADVENLDRRQQPANNKYAVHKGLKTTLANSTTKIASLLTNSNVYKPFPRQSDRLLTHGPGSLKVMKPEFLGVGAESRRNSGGQVENTIIEAEAAKTSSVLKEASQLAEDLNTTLKKLKIKSRGVLEKLTNSRRFTMQKLDGVFEKKGSSPSLTKKGERQEGEIKVLSLASNMQKEATGPTAAKSIIHNLNLVWST